MTRMENPFWDSLALNTAPSGISRSAITRAKAFLWNTRFCAYCAEPVPTIVIAAPSAGTLSTVWYGPLVIIAGAIVSVQSVPVAVMSFWMTNCCKTPVDCLLTGLTAYTSAMVNTSPALKVVELVQSSVMSVCVFVSLLAA